MKYELETIPIWTAYEAESECPLCFLMAKLEKDLLKFFLGSSVMDPATREKVNKKGFCAHHFEQLYHHGNHHGLALMAHTHWQQLQLELKERLAGMSIKKGFGAKSGFKKDVLEFEKWSAAKQDDCVFCEKRQEPLNRYIFTIIYLWNKDDQFKSAYSQSKGFCLSHLTLLIKMAPEVLSGTRLQEWYEITVNKTLENYKRLDDEVLWFTKKFDYQNHDKPWGNSKDSLPRVLNKIIGKKPE